MIWWYSRIEYWSLILSIPWCPIWIDGPSCLYWLKVKDYFISSKVEVWNLKYDIPSKESWIHLIFSVWRLLDEPYYLLEMNVHLIRQRSKFENVVNMLSQVGNMEWIPNPIIGIEYQRLPTIFITAIGVHLKVSKIENTF